MSNKKSSIFLALFSVAVLCAATASQAQSPLDGTWRTDLAQTKFSPKPLTFYISQGWYHCTAVATRPMTSRLTVRITLSPAIPMTRISVTIVDDHTISAVGKKGGTVMFEQTRSVSADGKTLDRQNHRTIPMSGGAPTTFETDGQAQRQAGLPACMPLRATGSSQKQSGSDESLAHHLQDQRRPDHHVRSNRRRLHREI